MRTRVLVTLSAALLTAVLVACSGPSGGDSASSGTSSSTTGPGAAVTTSDPSGTTAGGPGTAGSGAGTSSMPGGGSSSSADSPAPPAAPTGLTAVPHLTTAQLTWQPVAGATSYHVHIDYAPGGTRTTYGQVLVTATSFQQVGMTAGVPFFFSVTADNGVEGPASNEVTVMPWTQVADAPDALSGDGQATLTWYQVPQASSYNLYWSTTSGAGTAGTLIAGVSSGYVHTGLSNGTPYYYVVTAVIAGVESPPSLEAKVWPRGAAVAVAAGFFANYAITADGMLWSWGDNFFGELGTGGTPPVGWGHGSGKALRIGTGRDWASVSAGYGYALALQRDGSLWGWGSNVSGALGSPASATPVTTPVRLGSATWQSVVADDRQALGIRSDGTLWGWGGEFGRTQAGTPVAQGTPVQIGTSTWRSIATGSGTPAALDNNIAGIQTDGTLWAWGYTTSAQMNPYTFWASNALMNPIQVGTATDWSSVWAGQGSVYALEQTGYLWAWGINYDLINAGPTYGSPNGDTTASSLTVQWPPLLITSTAAWQDLLPNGFTILATQSGGSLWGWGRNERGTFGIGSGDWASGLPVGTVYGVPTSLGTAWSAIATDSDNVVAIKADGTLWAWGNNLYDKVGNGSTSVGNTDTDVLTPSRVK